MDKPFSASPPQPHLSLLTGTVVAATVVAGLYWGQSVLIPVAMAVLLAFLLTPAVRTLQRWHLDAGAYEAEIELTKQLLKADDKPHFTEFLDAWQKNKTA